MKIGIQGSRGAHSENAAIKLYPKDIISQSSDNFKSYIVKTVESLVFI